jgi:ethanolamine transporter EutH
MTTLMLIFAIIGIIAVSIIGALIIVFLWFHLVCKPLANLFKRFSDKRKQRGKG